MNNGNDVFEVELEVESCLPHEFSDFYNAYTTKAEREMAGPIEVRLAKDHFQLSDRQSEITNLLLVLGSSGALAILGKVACEWIKLGRVLFVMRDRKSGKDVRLEGKGGRAEKLIYAFFEQLKSEQNNISRE